MPARNEADPTTLLAVVVPVMFGYMFGDVGQGLVIAAVGFALRHRWPLARLFVAGGIGAAFFGLLFGSVFSLEGVIRPLWLEPLADPLTVLLVPLYGGAVLLTVGLLLNAVEAYWRGELRGWFCSEVWLAVVYVALLVGVVRPGAFSVAAAAAAAFCIGRAASARSLTAGFAAIAEIDRAHVADPHQHAFVLARGRVRAGSCGPVLRDRRADGRVPAASSRRRRC